MRKFLLVAGLAALVSGCGEKGDFEKAINAKISQSKLCYSLQDNDIVFNKSLKLNILIAVVSEVNTTMTMSGEINWI